MTLVELLVVISIMVTLVAVSIPVFKPMLESQRAAGAARVVAGTLQRVRVKAMQDQRVYGLEFIRFEEGNAPNVSIQMRLQRERTAFVTPEALRVVVIKGTIHVCALIDEIDGSGDPTGKRIWTWDTGNTDVATNRTTWQANVQGGYQIQLGRQGRIYELASAYKLAAPYDQLTLPDMELASGANEADWAVEAIVTRPPLPAFAPQVVLPRGTVVDLAFSGTTSELFAGAAPVAVMFSPAGYVDGIMSGSNNDVKKTNEMVYFCVGEWERQSLNAQGDTYAEDGLNNLLTTSNYWVTVHPRSGQVRVTQFAAASPADIESWRNETDQDQKQQNLENMIPGVREFATEHYVDIGGF